MVFIFHISVVKRESVRYIFEQKTKQTKVNKPKRGSGGRKKKKKKKDRKKNIRKKRWKHSIEN